MNPLAVLGIVLAISLAGNAWLFNSRDNALTAAERSQNEKINATNTALQCSLSVKALEDDARAAAEAAKNDIAAARELGKIEGGKGQKILQTARSTPGDECKSMSDLATQWNQGRRIK